MRPVPPDSAKILADAALMDRVACGDESAFATLMRAEAPRLARLGVSILASNAEAEEVMQEAFLRLWQQAATWQPEARVGTWLHGVVYRLSIDRLRRRRPSVAVEDVEEVMDSGETTPEEALSERQRAALVEAALARLSPRQRTAIVLAHYQGLSQAEASSVLDMTEEAYESLLARGRRRLKVLVSEIEAGGHVPAQGMETSDE